MHNMEISKYPGRIDPIIWAVKGDQPAAKNDGTTENIGRTWLRRYSSPFAEIMPRNFKFSQSKGSIVGSSDLPVLFVSSCAGNGFRKRREPWRCRHGQSRGIRTYVDQLRRKGIIISTMMSECPNLSPKRGSCRYVCSRTFLLSYPPLLPLRHLPALFSTQTTHLFLRERCTIYIAVELAMYAALGLTAASTTTVAAPSFFLGCPWKYYYCCVPASANSRPSATRAFNSIGEVVRVINNVRFIGEGLVGS